MQPARLGAAGWCVTAALLGTLALAPPGSAQAVETSQQTNDRIRALSASTRVPSRDYVVGDGDLLAVQVFDVPELSREVRVSQTGTIGIPLVPVRLHVSGLTELQIELKIAEVLESNGLVSNPQVSVAVKEKKSKPITVVGAVPHPMVYQADRAVTLVEVLAEVGGISSDAGDTVIVTRQQTDAPGTSSEPPSITPQDAAPAAAQDPAQVPTAPGTSPAVVSPSAAPSNPAAEAPQTPPPALSSTITVNLNELLETGDTSNNIVLEPGDVVTVPHAGIVYALGAVNRPGGFVVSNDRGQLTTLKLLSLAGGLDRTAKSDHAVIVRKDDRGQQHQVAVDLKKVLKFQAEDVRLEPSDILYVPKSAAKQSLIRAGELGIAIGTAIAIYRIIP